MKKAILYKKLRNNNLKCLACSHYCRISEGKTGICGVRQNIKGDLYLLVYGRPSAVQIDPIEKKPLYHFLPGSKVFSIGTLGCNFRCQFCQNWDLSQVSKSLQKTTGPKNLYLRIKSLSSELLPKKVVEFCQKEKIPSIAYTYNEPAIFFEYAQDIGQLAKKAGLKNIAVSNGYFSKEALERWLKFLDAVNIDLKSFREEFYQKICGAHLQPVLNNIERFYKAGVWLEITTLIIPGENDSEEELRQIAEFIASLSKSIPWHISRFFPCYQMIDKLPTPKEKIQEALEIGRKVGLKYVYPGNIDL